jgi:diacylglycerol diphosphate phosphatase / phosphatidate phosphatase
MACFGAITLGVHLAPPAPTRSFPIQFKDGEVVYPEFAYAPKIQILPIYATVILAAGVPCATVLLAQIRVSSFADANAGIFGAIQGLITGSLFQVMIKWLIGGLRPHFLAACKPDLRYCLPVHC